MGRRFENVLSQKTCPEVHADSVCRHVSVLVLAHLRTAGKSLRDLRVAEVEKFDVRIDEGGKVQFRCRLSLSFKYEG